MSCRLLFCLLSIIIIAYSQVIKVTLEQARLVPRMLNYQGYLTDTLGIPINDTVSMRFQIYDAENGGDDKWTEIQNNIPIKGGVFHVLLGSEIPIPDSVFTAGTDRWLELFVEGQLLSPRTRITSVGYAYNATYSDTADYARNADTDNDWSYSTPDSSVLFTASLLGIARGGASNELHGNNRDTHTNFGYACTTGTSTEDYFNCTVAGGAHNVAGGSRATVGGGYLNKARSTHSVIAGGYVNNITSESDYSCIVGGRSDSIKGRYCGILSGYSNKAGVSAIYDTAIVVTGGWNNLSAGDYSFIGSGRDNSLYSRYGTIISGYSNIIGSIILPTTASVIAGGYDNTSNGDYSFIGGGQDNFTSSADYATTVGGYADTVWSKYSCVLGGYSNTAGSALDSCVVVVGGQDNSATGRYTFVGGGHNNNASTLAGVVCGGQNNSAGGVGSSVIGGYSNVCNGDYGFVAGQNSSITAGANNCVALNGQSVTSGVSGRTRVGILQKTSGTFTIDHPLDPMNKILNHYFVESPEMVLIYRGVVHLDKNGRAEVMLPDYFDALNKNPQIQLTGVGTYEVFIVENVRDNRFVIGGKPDTEVHWTVTGERSDPSAEITKIVLPVEQSKEGEFIGHSIDDDFLATTKDYLDKIGRADGFTFRTEKGRQKYEEMQRMTSERK